MQKTRKFVVCLTLLLICGIQPGACPVRAPLTLRELSAASEMIVAAKLRRVLSEEAASNNREISAIRRLMMRAERSVKAEFEVTRVVKGSFYVATVEVALSTYELESVPKDQDLLLFLERGAAGKEFVVAGTQNEGMKNKPEKDLAVYATRIKELLTITAEKDEAVRNPQLTEWLVQCVEEPVTRREALDDFVSQHFRLRWQKEAAEREKAAIAEGEADADEADAEEAAVEAEAESGDDEAAPSTEANDEPEASPRNEEPETNLVALLTDAQKQRLLQILYQAPRLGENEINLIELAEDWNDDHFIPFLWSYFKTGQPDEPYVVTELIEQLAKPYPLNEDAQQMSHRYENAANGISESDDDEDDEEDENETPAKAPQPAADPQVLRREFIKLIESLGAPRLVTVKSETP